MAKFVTDDGRGGISEDKLIEQHRLSIDKYDDDTIYPIKKKHTDVPKMSIPHGKCNRHRLLNTNTYDMLVHLQETLSLNKRCILELITNEDHKCIGMNETITKKIRVFSEEHMDDSFMELTHLAGWDKNDTTDDIYKLFMHLKYPNKLKMFCCEECIQQWLNSEKW